MRTTRLAVPATLACAAVLLPASAAAAAEPERTGWWNRLSAAGTALPAPSAQPGDLRVGAGPDGPTAYAAVLYTAPGSASATLDLTLRSVTGTPEVLACPTESTDWPEGENQPYDKAPPYDCELAQAPGIPSDDGTTLSFALDSTLQTEPGVWSLALVPAPDAAGVFVVDVEKPGPEAFQAEAPETSTQAPPSFDTGSTSGGPAADGGGSGEAFLPEAFEVPADAGTGGTTEAPLLAGDTAPLPAADAAPAPTLATGAAPGTTPLLTATPAGVVEDLGSGRRLLALLVLAGGSAAVGYAAGQQRPGPRLIGGRSRLGSPAVATAVPAALPAAERPRGIGRFAKARDAAPPRRPGRSTWTMTRS